MPAALRTATAVRAKALEDHPRLLNSKAALVEPQPLDPGGVDVGEPLAGAAAEVVVSGEIGIVELRSLPVEGL